MISVQEAKQMIAGFHRLSGIRKVMLTESLGKVLAADLLAPIPLPHFIQSSVDGYAVAFGEQIPHEFELLEGESSAGSPSTIQLKPGQALRIFTGAAVPTDTNAVVMQEKIKKENNHIITDPSLLENGMNIRQPGTDLQLNELALPKGSRMNPAKIGLLASLGIDELPVFDSPAISILITGNEFAEQGEVLRNGLIYESNSFMLEAGLRQAGVENINIKRIKDDPDFILEALEEFIPLSDIVMITGGVSVGDYDYTVQSAEKAGVKQIFHKIAQRPGKPMYFGMKNDVFVFGLPGNMSSVLTCFYMYITPLISSMQHLPDPVNKIEAILSEDVKSPEGLTSFLKGFCQNGYVRALPGQESYKLKSYADANCLIEIPENITRMESGNKVTVYLLPNS